MGSDMLYMRDSLRRKGLSVEFRNLDLSGVTGKTETIMKRNMDIFYFSRLLKHLVDTNQKFEFIEFHDYNEYSDGWKMVIVSTENQDPIENVSW